ASWVAVPAARAAPSKTSSGERGAGMLTDEQLRFYDENGYLRLGRILTKDELRALQRRIDDIMLGRVVYEGMFFQLDSETGRYGDLAGGGYAGPTLNYRKIQDLERDPLFLAFM